MADEEACLIGSGLLQSHLSLQHSVTSLSQSHSAIWLHAVNSTDKLHARFAVFRDVAARAWLPYGSLQEDQSSTPELLRQFIGLLVPLLLFMVVLIFVFCNVKAPGERVGDEGAECRPSHLAASSEEARAGKGGCGSEAAVAEAAEPETYSQAGPRGTGDRGAAASGESAERVVVVLVGTFLAAGANYGIAPPVVPLHLESLEADQLWAGMTIAALDFGVVLFAPVAQLAMARFGHRAVIIVGNLLQAVFCMMCGFNDAIVSASGGSQTVLLCFGIIWRIGAGVGISSAMTASLALALGRFGSSGGGQSDGWRYNEVAAYGEASVGLGQMVVAPLATLLFALGGYPLPFVVCGALMLPLLQVAWGLETLDEGDNAVTDSPGILDVMTPRFALVSISILVNMATGHAVWSTLALYSENTVGLATPAIGLLFAVMFAPFIVSAPYFGRLADSIGAQKVLAVGSIALGLSTGVLFGLSGRAFSAGSSVRIPYIATAALLFSTAMAASYAPVVGALSEAAEGDGSKAENAISTVNVLLWGMAGIIGPLLGIATVGLMGFEGMCMLFGSGLAATGILLLWTDQKSAAAGST